MDDLTTRITAALDRAEDRAHAAMWAATTDASEWTYKPSTAPYERPIVADGLGDGVVIVQPENADPEGVGEHVAHWDPEAVLDLISAHREILALAERVNEQRHEHAEGEAKAWLMDEVRTLLAKAHRIEVPE